MHIYKIQISCFYFLECWHQYDDTIFPQPTWRQAAQNMLPYFKSMNTVEGREIATRAMLPHWKGFCVDDVAGENMTAWEAVEQVQNVANCMTKSQTKLQGQSAQINVPYDYNFYKVSMCLYTVV